MILIFRKSVIKIKKVNGNNVSGQRQERKLLPFHSGQYFFPLDHYRLKRKLNSMFFKYWY